MSTSTRRIAAVPCLVGLLLWTGATALLCEDALRTAHVTINHALQPLLTAGTVAAAVYAHHRISSWRLFSGVAFLALALLGSLATVYGTLARTATARDVAQADAMAANRQLGLKTEALEAAKREAVRECRPIGPRCKDWLARVDQLTQEMAPLRALAVDPRANAIGNLAELMSMDGKRVRAIVGALDPVVLPLFLEAGCIVFFAAAFPFCRNPLQLAATDGNDEATVDSCAPWTQAAALGDFLRLGNPAAQWQLAARWGVDKSTVSRWLRQWESECFIQRRRDGRLQFVAPRRWRSCIVHG
jgi:hypothetical protein